MRWPFVYTIIIQPVPFPAPADMDFRLKTSQRHSGRRDRGFRGA